MLDINDFDNTIIITEIADHFGEGNHKILKVVTNYLLKTIKYVVIQHSIVVNSDFIIETDDFHIALNKYNELN